MKSAKGITFIELILVLAIMLTISVMAPVFYSRFLLQNSVANTTDQLVGSLRKAQMHSMMSKEGSQWSVNYSSNTITLYKGSTFTGHDTSFDETFSLNSNVTIDPTPLDISFTRMTGAQSSSVTTVTISSGTNSQQITINAQGMVTR